MAPFRRIMVFANIPTVKKNNKITFQPPHHDHFGQRKNAKQTKREEEEGSRVKFINRNIFCAKTMYVCVRKK
jgi:hypothetical protein